MFFSKLWILLLAVAAALAFGMVLVVPKAAFREVAKAQAENLDRGQHNADLMLRLEARDWIDAVAKMAWDSAVVDGLEQASNRKTDFKPLQAKVGGRLLSLVARIRSEMRPQLLIAVDARGKQLARVGAGEDRYTAGEDGLAGYPLVEAALRGYRGDDTWSLDGRLYLMAASPVISRSRGRYVGALLLGQELNDAFARRLKARLAGTDVAFFLRGAAVGASLASVELGKLPAQYGQRQEQIVRDGRSAALRVGEGRTALNVILAPLPGEAAEHQSFYAAIGVPPPRASVGEVLGLVRKADLSWEEFPWLLVGGGLLIALIIGIGLTMLEVDAPLRHLLGAFQRLAKREASRVEDQAHSGRFGSLARAVNEALEKARQARPLATSQPPSSGRESGGRAAISEPLSRAPDSGLSSLPLAVDSQGVQALRGLSADFPEVKPPPLAMQEPRPAYRPDPGVAAFEQAALAASAFGDNIDLPQARSDLLPELNVSATVSAPLRDSTQSREAAPVTGGAAAAFNLEPLLMPLEPGGARPAIRQVRIPEAEELALPPPNAASPFLPFPEVSLPDAASMELTPLHPGDGGGFVAPPLPAGDNKTSQGLPAVTAADLSEAPPADAEEEYFRQVFKEFLTVKRQCGESTSNLTFERFAEKLQKNRSALVERYSCKAVKFQVYIKDGKAALKATPVKE